MHEIVMAKLTEMQDLVLAAYDWRACFRWIVGLERLETLPVETLLHLVGQELAGRRLILVQLKASLSPRWGEMAPQHRSSKIIFWQESIARHQTPLRHSVT